MRRGAYERLRLIALKLAESAPRDDWSKFATLVTCQDGKQVVVTFTVEKK